MVYVLHGRDDFSIWQALNEIKTDLGDAQMLAVNTTRLDGQRLTLRELEDSCSVAPFLSPYRLTIVDGLLERFETKAGRPGFSKRRVMAKPRGGLMEWEGLPSYIEQMPPTTVLVLVDGKISSNNSLLKKLSPLARIRACPVLRGKSLKVWIQERVTQESSIITAQAVDLLADLIGGNLWVMNNEIAKLLLYAAGRPIGEEDVRQLVSNAQEANIFLLVDAVLEGQTRTAQGVLHRLYQEGASPNYILTMIGRQFRLVALASGLSSGLSRQALQGELGLSSSYALDRTLSQAKLYDSESIKEAYNKLLETDLAVKTGKYDGQLALELLIAELSASRC
jgi:DNA polymerase-3 subunit delta